jgi:hypothetical protein
MVVEREGERATCAFLIRASKKDGERGEESFNHS